MIMEELQVVAGVIIKNGRFLAGKRAAGRLGAAKWELPGGKLHPGEDPRAGLARELAEELGCPATVGERVLPTITVPGASGTVHLQVFYAKLAGEPHSTGAQADLRWGTPAELAGLDWLPATKPVLEKLAAVDLAKLVVADPAQLWTHQVAYYETDRMGITHHSNYIRWMEEARTHFLATIGWDYRRFEEAGLISPVVSVNCRYKQPTTFGDQVDIFTSVKQVDKIKLTLEYTFTKEGKVVGSGESSHCFTKDGRLVRLDRDLADFKASLEKFLAD